MGFPATDPTDNQVSLDDKKAAEKSTNKTIDAVRASGIGSAHVCNECPFEVVLQRCYQPTLGAPAGCNAIKHLAANGGIHTERYTLNANDGISR